MKDSLRIAIVGGDGRSNLSTPDGVTVRRYSSSRYGGNGEQRALINAIMAGGVDAVLLMVRWMGHSAFNNICKACRACGIEYIIVPGGESSAVRALHTLAEGG